jgi:hypothetical protein
MVIFAVREEDVERRRVHNPNYTAAQVAGKPSRVSPYVQDGKILRELADVLGFDSDFIYVAQAKAMAVLTVNSKQPSSRGAGNVEKEVGKKSRTVTPAPGSQGRGIRRRG